MKQHITSKDLVQLNSEGKAAICKRFNVSELSDINLERITIGWMVRFLYEDRKILSLLKFNTSGVLIESNRRPEFHTELADALWSICRQSLDNRARVLNRTVRKKAKECIAMDRAERYGDKERKKIVL